MEMSVRNDFWQKDSSKSERKALQDGSETCYDIWIGDTDTDKKTGGGSGRFKDAEIFIGSDQDWQG